MKPGSYISEKPEDGGSSFLQDQNIAVVWYIPHHMESHAIRLYSPLTPATTSNLEDLILQQINSNYSS
jgi:hypothetical protein